MSRIIDFFKNRYYLISVPLIFLSFPTFDLWVFKMGWFFGWISLVPVFLYIRSRGFRDSYFLAFATAVFSNVMLYEWIGNFTGDQTSGYVLIVILLIPFMSIFFALKLAVAEKLSQRFEKLRIFIFPAVWLFIDFIQSIGFLAFPWINWGHSQFTFTSFIQISSFIGLTGINFLIILFNYILSDYIFSIKGKDFNFKEKISGLFNVIEGKRVLGFIAIFILIVVYGNFNLYINNREIKKDLRVSIVQSCISPWANWSRNRFKYLGELKKQTELSLKENPDFIIWSESATLETISYDSRRNSYGSFVTTLMGYIRVWNLPLLTGEIGVVTKKNERGFIKRYPQNSAVLISSSGEVVETYPKINLVPFGEWFPYEKWFPSIKRLIESYGGSNFVPGKKAELLNVNGYDFGALICYEGIFYRLCREYKNLGAKFLINITNDGWTDKYRGHLQHFTASVFRAVENGIWLVRAGNTGLTTIIDPYGRIVGEIPILKQGYLVGDLDFSFNHDTVYTKIGDIFTNLSIIFLFLLLIFLAVGRIGLYRKKND